MMSGQGKQAKVLSDKQVAVALRQADAGAHPLRDRAMLLLSIKAGLRAKEIALLRWSMVTDAEGEIGDSVELTNAASKGRSGRPIRMHSELRAALLKLAGDKRPKPAAFVIEWKWREDVRAVAVQVWFHRFYRSLGWDGASSHSGRRTFVTKVARRIVEAGGSLKDVQELAGHQRLSTTGRYIEGSSDAKRRVIEMI
jgi:integrase